VNTEAFFGAQHSANTMQIGLLMYELCSGEHVTKEQNFDLGLKGQSHSDLSFVHYTLLCLNAYSY